MTAAEELERTLTEIAAVLNRAPIDWATVTPVRPAGLAQPSDVLRRIAREVAGAAVRRQVARHAVEVAEAARLGASVGRIEGAVGRLTELVERVPAELRSTAASVGARPTWADDEGCAA